MSQPTIDQFGIDEGEDASGTVLFRLGGDPFVNEGAAELGRQLKNAGVATVERETVVVSSRTRVGTVIDQCRSIIESALPRTHTRTAAARGINTALSEMGANQNDDRWVGPPDQPFPSNQEGGNTIYPDDTVSEGTLDEFNLDPESVGGVEGDSNRLYTQSPEFTGNTSSRHFPGKHIPRFEDAFAAFEQTLRESFEGDDAPCMNCGSVEMPTRKDPDGEKLEYNISFTPLSASSGRLSPLGARSRTSAHPDRCAACLVAGFYYSIMPKAVRPAGESNDSRIFCPLGDLAQVAAIRTDFAAIRNEVDPPTEGGYQGRRSLGQLITNSRGMQTLEFYEQVVRHLNTEYSGGELDRQIQFRPTELAVYECGQGESSERTISAVEQYDPDQWAYEVVSPRRFDDERYWPVSNVLYWFAELGTDDNGRLTDAKDALGFGILFGDLERIERASMTILKELDQTESRLGPPAPHPGYRSEYFTHIMSNMNPTTESIDDDALESVRQVASAIGRVFHDQDGLSVLIKLQNASTPTEFLQAFEKAAMQAQKASIEQAPSQWDTSRDDDVGAVLELISDRETFEPAKRMFVIHASLAAQYENATQSDEDSSEQESAPESSASSSD